MICLRYLGHNPGSMGRVQASHDKYPQKSTVIFISKKRSLCKDSKHSGVNSCIRSSMGFARTDHIVALFAFFL